MGVGVESGVARGWQQLDKNTQRGAQWLLNTITCHDTKGREAGEVGLELETEDGGVFENNVIIKRSSAGVGRAY